MIAARISKFPAKAKQPGKMACAARAPRVLVVEDERHGGRGPQGRLWAVLGYVVAGVAATRRPRPWTLCRLPVSPDIVLMDIFLRRGHRWGGSGLPSSGIPLRRPGHLPHLPCRSGHGATGQAFTAPYGYVLKPVDRELDCAQPWKWPCASTRPKQELRRSEQRYRQLFTRMLNACLLLELLPGEPEATLAIFVSWTPTRPSKRSRA